MANGDEYDAFCFRCGINFNFGDKCNCDQFQITGRDWVIKPTVGTELDETYWFPRRVCVFSSHDGSFGLMTDRPDPFNQ